MTGCPLSFADAFENQIHITPSEGYRMVLAGNRITLLYVQVCIGFSKGICGEVFFLVNADWLSMVLHSQVSPPFHRDHAINVRSVAGLDKALLVETAHITVFAIRSAFLPRGKFDL